MMAKTRVPIPDSLAAEVMFASDRTCCVCRSEKKVQIHHIDEDPSNNTFENLTVICLHCHSDAHTNGAFVRNLSPELIRLYNTSWRDIVKLRLRHTAEAPGKSELASEAYLEASLDCHRWKAWFMSLARQKLPNGTPGEYTDVWDLMTDLWIPEYSEDTYLRYFPLFNEGLREVQARFDRLIQIFPDIFPPDFRSLIVRAHRQIDVERTVYEQLPALVNSGVFPADGISPLFHGRFVGVVHVLRDVSRDADRRRESLINA